MNNDQRTSPRHEFPYDQLVALVADGKLPSLGDFCTVPYEDVSGSGIAFFLEKEPTAEEYVAALGKARSLIYVCARVAFTTSGLLAWAAMASGAMAVWQLARLPARSMRARIARRHRASKPASRELLEYQLAKRHQIRRLLMRSLGRTSTFEAQVQQLMSTDPPRKFVMLSTCHGRCSPSNG